VLFRSRRASEKGDVLAYLVLPSTIFGVAKHKLAQPPLSVSNPLSQQIPLKVKATLRRKPVQVGSVGPGENVWPLVHIEDIAGLFVLVLEGALKGSIGEGWEGFYFGENGHYKLIEVDSAIGKILYEQGIAETPQVKPFTPEEVEELLGTYLGTNSRAKATRSRSIGWKPKYGHEDFFKSLPEEVVIVASLFK